MRKDTPSWNETFMTLARVMAKRSKDPSTQVGAIIVSPDKKTIYTGYNGMPAGFPETEEKWERPEKYKYVVHAEMNAILHAKEDLTDWTLYVTNVPCSECAKNIAQSGIKTIYYIEDVNPNSELGYDTFITICREMGIKVIKYDE